jgi:hypothetical protein
VTSIYETTDRLIDEELNELLVLAWDMDDRSPSDSAEPGHRLTMPLVRLISAALLMHQRHNIDTRGRCRICTSRGRLWRRVRMQPCTVYAALNFYLTQPDGLVLRDMHRPRARPMPRPAPDTLPTIELPRIRDGWPGPGPNPPPTPLRER